MSRKTVFTVVGLIAALAFGAGYLAHRPVVGPVAGGRQILYYVDPMHPAYRSEKPGIAPDCGMQLAPVYADGVASAEGDAGLPPGSVRITPGSRQLIGVMTAVVESAPVNYPVRLLGRVVPDEGRIYRVNSSIAGFVKEISPVTTGAFVKRDQYLASVYSPDLYAPINSYIFSLNSIDRQQKLTPENIKIMRQDVNIRGNRNALINIGMSETQLDEILKTRYNREVIDIRASEGGYVLSRNISLGERFERGVEFYRIVDLSRVWIMADIFENEASYFTPGVRCTVRLPQRNLSFSARVGSVLPLYDPATRTLKVRLEAENSAMVLRPEMFVNVELPVSLPAVVTVPREALLDSGLKQTVFVDRGNNIFEPRIVEAGRHFGERVEIVKGLTPGEKIVIAGNFLLDSESRLKSGTSGLSGTPGKDPVCGMALDEEKARGVGLTREYGGKSYFFCSPEDMVKFNKEPRRYSGAGAVTPTTSADPSGGAVMKPMKMDHGSGSGGMPPSRSKGSSGMNGMDPMTPGLGSGRERRNFPTPLDDPGEMSGSGGMPDTPPASSAVPPAPEREVPNLSTINIPPAKTTPPHVR